MLLFINNLIIQIQNIVAQSDTDEVFYDCECVNLHI
jgi:hypothetical protein